MTSPNEQVPAEERILSNESIGWELFWEKNRSVVLGAVGLIIVAGVGFTAWVAIGGARREAAQHMLAEAKTADAYQAVADKYAGTAPALDASFLLAAALRDSGKIEESNATYGKILEKYSGQPIVSGARLGLAENLGLQGKLEASLIALREVQTADSSAYAAPFAALLEGRILVRQGKYNDAQKVFGNLTTTYPQSPAARVAKSQLQELQPFVTK